MNMIQKDWNSKTLTFALTFLHVDTDANAGGIAIALLHESAGMLTIALLHKSAGMLKNYDFLTEIKAGS